MQLRERLLTAEEFSLLPDPPNGEKQELVRGKVVTIPISDFQRGFVRANIGVLLKSFEQQHKIGRTTLGCGIITERDPDTVRGPDVSFWSFERIPADQMPVAYLEVAADLCVEVRSPSNTTRNLTSKAKEYLAAGARLVWIVDPEERTVTIYRQPNEGRVISDEATITGEDVLPGFECRVAEFFE